MSAPGPPLKTMPWPVEPPLTKSSPPLRSNVSPPPITWHVTRFFSRPITSAQPVPWSISAPELLRSNSHGCGGAVLPSETKMLSTPGEPV